MSQRSFSGRECWVYAARDPSELPGHHAQLIASRLGNAPASCLVYSPRRDVGGAPFNLPEGGGSHALAVGDESLIISRDSHRDDEPPSVITIPFGCVLALEFGEALTLGWLRVRFAAGAQMATQVIYFNSTGIDIFRDVCRHWMRRLPPVPVDPGTTRRPPLATSPTYLTGQLQPLLDEQSVLLLEGATEEWRLVGRRLSCVSGAAMLALTRSMAIVVESEQPLRPGMHVFGVNVMCVPRQAMTAARISVDDADSNRPVVLSLSVQAGGVVTDITHHLSLTADAIERLASLLTGRTGAIQVGR